MEELPGECRGPRSRSRREMVQLGASFVLGLGLPTLLQAGEKSSRTRSQGSDLTPTADSCIVIFLDGGPSHLDMWDMKPNAPAEIRGEFKPIATKMPGVQVCEHLPRFSRQVHLGTLIRSAHHSVNNSHGAAVYTSLTGHDQGEVGGVFRPTDNPAIGSVVGLRRPPVEAVPPYVSMPYITAEGAGGPPQGGFFGGWLGRSYDPLFVLKDPSLPDFAMPEMSLPEGRQPATARRETEARRRPWRPAVRHATTTADSATSTAFRNAPSTSSPPPPPRTPSGSIAKTRESATATAGTSTARACSWRAG